MYDYHIGYGNGKRQGIDTIGTCSDISGLAAFLPAINRELLRILEVIAVYLPRQYGAVGISSPSLARSKPYLYLRV